MDLLLHDDRSLLALQGPKAATVLQVRTLLQGGVGFQGAYGCDIAGRCRGPRPPPCCRWAGRVNKGSNVSSMRQDGSCTLVSVLLPTVNQIGLPGLDVVGLSASPSAAKLC